MRRGLFILPVWGLILLGCTSGIGPNRPTLGRGGPPTPVPESNSFNGRPTPDLGVPISVPADGPDLGNPGASNQLKAPSPAIPKLATRRPLPSAVRRSSGYRGIYQGSESPEAQTTPVAEYTAPSKSAAGKSTAAQSTTATSTTANPARTTFGPPGKGYVELDPPDDAAF